MPGLSRHPPSDTLHVMMGKDGRGCRHKAGMTIVLLLAGCIPAGRPDSRQQPFRPSPGETAMCLSDLSAASVRFRALPDRVTGPGCGQFGTVQLTDIGVPVTGLGAMQCGVARAFATWVREDVAPAAQRTLGSRLLRVETFGTYACRNVVGSAANAERRSGHALANAVDVGAFRLADGRRVSVLADWNGQDEPTRDFLRAVRRAACRRFGTVLSPDYNAAHADHLHLEADRAGFCR